LDASIAAHLKVSREWQFPVRLSGFKARLDHKTFAGAAAAFEWVGLHGLPLSAQVLAGIAGSAAFSVSADIGLAKSRTTGTPFEYVSRFHDEIF
jgi:hypothetical protein